MSDLDYLIDSASQETLAHALRVALDHLEFKHRREAIYGSGQPVNEEILYEIEGVLRGDVLRMKEA